MSNPLMAIMAVTIVTAFAVASAAVEAGEVVVVSIEKMQFIPQQIKIKPGTTVKWVNNEKRNNHSIFFEQEGLPESDRLFPEEFWQRTFEKPGVYPYLCGPHHEMTGVVEVAE